jgi:flavin reductase (DIM6/NTAB) family NADH-FMN oxidoreductase RutF
MVRNPIPIEKFIIKPFHLWDVQSLLLTSGDFSRQHFNAMTIGWGSIGYIWRRPFIQVVVRPVRYTYEFMEEYDTFTVCAFPVKYHAALQLLGTRSGRDGDKIAASGLTLMVSTKIPAPGYKEASLILECRKIYWDDLNPSNILEPGIELHYPQKDYHRIYFGEILAIYGSKVFEE